jgi:hypothetical protein
LTDQSGVSREKLSYIVDSTAAPVAGVSIFLSDPRDVPLDALDRKSALGAYDRWSEERRS